MDLHFETLSKSIGSQTYFIFFGFLISLTIKLFSSLYYKLTKKITKYIDLHFHIDGSITVDIARQLSAIQNIPLPTLNEMELENFLSVPENCEDLNQFLNCFNLPLKLLQTKLGITQAVRLLGESIKSQGVIYAEFRFAPQLHTKKGLTRLRGNKINFTKNNPNSLFYAR